MGLKNQYEVVNKGAATVTPKSNPNNFTLVDQIGNLGLVNKATNQAVPAKTSVPAPAGQKFVLRVNYTTKALNAANNDKSKLRLAYFDGSKWVPYASPTKDDLGWTVSLTDFLDPPIAWGL
jgi:hypothetical protein